MISEIRRGLNVKRFHTTQRFESETVGHHSANVAAILLRLDPNCSRDLLICALMHDVDEAYTGDVPAPFKWENPDVKQGLADGGMKYMEEQGIPYPEISVHERRLLKLADMLDLVFSSMEELNKGNLYAKELITNGQDYIIEMYNGGHIPAEVWASVEIMIMEVKNGWLQTTDK